MHQRQLPAGPWMMDAHSALGLLRRMKAVSREHAEEAANVLAMPARLVPPHLHPLFEAMYLLQLKPPSPLKH